MRERSANEPSHTESFPGDLGPYRLRPSEHDPSVLIVERQPPPPPATAYRWRLPLLLFVLTVLSTSLAGGFVYSAAVLLILTCHEMGHFIQARRYGVMTSLPYFIPMIPPLGTMGAVIAMRPRSVGAKGLFDIAITGPLAGLVPACAFSIWGLAISRTAPNDSLPDFGLTLGEPLLFRWFSGWLIDVPADHTLLLHPLAYAGWVGILVTALNLLPVSQLDGGHILYALIPRHAHRVSLAIFGAAGVAILAMGLWHWSLLYLLILIFGVRHPPLGVYGERLGRFRRILGWATLAFLFVGFTPVPLSIPDLPTP